MIRASIDIGTNTVLLLVAKVDSGGKLHVLHEEQRIPRLGKGVDKSRNLSLDSMNRVADAIREYKHMLAQNFPQVTKPIVTATSAVRDANNRDVFLDLIRSETGVNVEVLSGEREAEYTFRGALSVLPDIGLPVAVLDIGGGSTEVALGTAGGLIDRFSFDIGSVRFTERFFRDDPPLADAIEACRASIRSELNRRLFSLPETTVLVGVAGTVTSLAYMSLGLKEYSANVLNGQQLSRDQIQNWVKSIGHMPTSKLLQEFPQVMAGRADVFLAGLLILDEFMDIYRFGQLMVSTGGIRHGVLSAAGR